MLQKLRLAALPVTRATSSAPIRKTLVHRGPSLETVTALLRHPQPAASPEQLRCTPRGLWRGHALKSPRLQRTDGRQSAATRQRVDGPCPEVLLNRTLWSRGRL